MNTALVCGLVPRCQNLAFVAESLESSADGQGAYVRIHNPMTLTSTLLPAGHKLGTVSEGDPVRVSYVVLPPGTLQPPTGLYTIPHDAPYPKGRSSSYTKGSPSSVDGLVPQWDTTHKIIGAKKLTPEDMRRYESIYDPTQNQSEETKAKAVEEVLLGELGRTAQPFISTICSGFRVHAGSGER